MKIERNKIDNTDRNDILKIERDKINESIRNHISKLEQQMKAFVNIDEQKDESTNYQNSFSEIYTNVSALYNAYDRLPTR